jgi:hypothetical protein
MRLFVASLLVLVLSGCSQVAALAPPPPTATPVPPVIQPLPGRTLSIDGHGATQTIPIAPDYAGTLAVGISVVTLQHSGRSTFSVTAIQSGQAEELATVIGSYRGQRPLVVTGAVAFDVVADGDWSLRVQPLATGGTPAFSGRGDLVSAYFTPPAPGDWFLAHDGTKFTAWVHCVGGSAEVAQHTEAFMESSRITFGRGPCFWEVRGDGLWSLTPAR